jgi:hypothetical protein
MDSFQEHMQSCLMRPHRGWLIHVLAVSGLAIPPLSLLAWALGENDLQLMAAGHMDRSGKEQTENGRNLGKATTWIYGFIAVIAFTIWASSSH